MESIFLPTVGVVNRINSPSGTLCFPSMLLRVGDWGMSGTGQPKVTIPTLSAHPTFYSARSNESQSSENHFLSSKFRLELGNRSEICFLG